MTDKLTPAQVPRCRADCGRAANGYDGFCEPCARERERDGRWETIPLVVEENGEATEQESTTAPDGPTDEAGPRLYLRGA